MGVGKTPEILVKNPALVRANIITLLQQSPDNSWEIEKLSSTLKAELNDVNKEITYLLEQGIIFEPKPGFIKED